MPLTRDTVTVASRIMLPAYIGHAAFFGVLYIVDPGERYTRNPGLAFARMMLTMDRWGTILLIVAGLMATALLTRRRPIMVAALYLYMAVNLMWGAIYLGAPFVNVNASWGGVGHPVLIGVACIASARSLQKREV